MPAQSLLCIGRPDAAYTVVSACGGKYDGAGGADDCVGNGDSQHIHQAADLYSNPLPSPSVGRLRSGGREPGGSLPSCST